MQKEQRNLWVLRIAGLVALAMFAYYYFSPRFAGYIAVDGVAFSLGSITVYWYGIIIALAIAFSYFYFIRPSALRLKINDDKLSSLIILVILCGIVGARLGYVVQFIGSYSENWWQIFYVWNGGVSIHGALIGGALAILWWGRRNKINAKKLLDAFSPAVIFAMALGRLGNFYNQELYGRPSSAFWKMYLPPARRPEELINSDFFHPVFLYEMIFDLLILAILLAVQRKKTKPGAVFVLFIFLYSLARFITEFWRYNENYYFFNLSLAQIVSVVLIVVSTTAYLLISRSTRNKFLKHNTLTKGQK